MGRGGRAARGARPEIGLRAHARTPEKLDTTTRETGEGAQGRRARRRARREAFAGELGLS
ncbi:hypothetical protein BE21_48415 [Sorangium cellulosum]|uniref:Uncharacterized protein n=1 Tax=Sorangium cellulosum TaxID=56 RepID=A0A150THE7_SORCE|nr:hypothetical protein BE21_48415 [Sorangium cellulosum]